MLRLLLLSEEEGSMVIACIVLGRLDRGQNVFDL